MWVLHITDVTTTVEQQATTIQTRKSGQKQEILKINVKDEILNRRN
jgi:hypothetical protein